VNHLNRRSFCAATAALTAAASTSLAARPKSQMRLGLVTYNWGKSWDIPTLIQHCEATGFEGVELRSTHQHQVEIGLTAEQRKSVAKQFADSKTKLVGLGSACEYHAADPAVVKKNIEETKAFVRLCRDVGGHGVKVRPNGLPQGVPEEKTLVQIGKSLNEVARFGADYGVKIRLEVHGRGTSEIPRIRKIMEVADHPNAVVCWNCNPTDLIGEGLERHYQQLQKKIEVIHIHDLRNDKYPWKQFFGLLKAGQFSGWTLLEEGRVPQDIVAAMHENRKVWEQLTQ